METLMLSSATIGVKSQEVTHRDSKEGEAGWHTGSDIGEGGRLMRLQSCQWDCVNLAVPFTVV
jgi:hypothetical protein